LLWGKGQDLTPKARAAKAAELLIAAATGGPVKGALNLAADKAIEAMAGDKIAQVMDKVTNQLGHVISDVNANADEFAEEAANENFISQGLIKDGGRFILSSIVGVPGKAGTTSPTTTVPSLPKGYSRNPDGTITGPGMGNAADTGYKIDGKPVYQRESGGYYVIDENGIQKPVDSPRELTAIGDQREHHNAIVDKLKADMESDGYTVEKDVRIFSSCGTIYCKPDIVHTNAEGNVGFIEVKTGNADFSTNQKAIFKEVGKGQYIIPPDSKLSPQAAEAIGVPYKPGLTVAEAGYPNGIPVVVRYEPGLGD
jgi:flagellar hook-associated protein FlgK